MTFEVVRFRCCRRRRPLLVFWLPFSSVDNAGKQAATTAGTRNTKTRGALSRWRIVLLHAVLLYGAVGSICAPD